MTHQMTQSTVEHDPGWYLRLIDFAQQSDAATVWSPSEVQTVWSHQLDASVPTCIEELSPVEALHALTLCESASPAITSLRDLFSRADPEVQLLTMVARWMEQTLGDPDELLPRDVSVSLFNIAIVLARSRCATRLIQTTDLDLARRADWVASRPWIDANTAQNMRHATEQLGGIDSQEAR